MLKSIAIFLLLSTIAFALPQPSGWVNDYANVIEPEWEPKLVALINEIEKNTTAEIAVVTVPSLEDKSVEELGLQYLEEWGVGKKTNDNGIVIIVAPNERKYRIEVGYGSEGAINDARAGRIGRDILALYFKEGRYGEGIYEAVNEIGGLLRNDPDIIASYSPRHEFFSNLAPFLFFFGFIITGIIANFSATSKKRKFLKYCISEGVFIAILIFLGIWAPFFAFLLVAPFLFVIGLIIFASALARGMRPGGGFWMGGRSSGGFGGFGGGSGGGGGASGGW